MAKTSEHILIIDDDPHILLSAQLLLEANLNSVEVLDDPTKVKERMGSKDRKSVV